VAGGRIELEAFLGLPDGTRLARARGDAPMAEAEGLGRDVARRLLEGGGREILGQLGVESRSGHAA
jgi:porphobilinogen deaminase